MDGEGFEPSKALPTDLQSAPFGHSGIHPFIRSWHYQDLTINLYHIVIQIARTFFPDFCGILKQSQMFLAIPL